MLWHDAAVEAAIESMSGDRLASALGRPRRVAVFVATILAIVAVALLPLLTPLFIHPVLEAAGSASRLGMPADVARRMSDLSVAELVLGPGTFAFAGPTGIPFYDVAERGHLADARLLLWLCLGAGIVSALIVGLSLARAGADTRRQAWRIISRAGATSAGVVIALGAVSVVAFDTLFELFHRAFFPGGNYSFDPATQHLVQLYPFAFWQLASLALAILVVLLGLGTWLLGRVMASQRLG